MTTTTPEAVEPPARTGRFYGTWAVVLIASLFLQFAGASVTPLTDLWAAPPAAVAPDAPAPGEPAPVDPGTAAPEPSAPVASGGICETGTGALTVRVCDAAEAAGWAVTAEGEIMEGVPFTLVEAEGDYAGHPPFAVNERFGVTSLQSRETLTLAHTYDGLTTAAVEPLPSQSDSSLATEARAVLAQPEVWFLNGGNIVDGPDLSLGAGWSIATAYDPSRPVGSTVQVQWLTLTVEQSDPSIGTVYAVT